MSTLARGRRTRSAPPLSAPSSGCCGSSWRESASARSQTGSTARSSDGSDGRRARAQSGL